jgi:hypothetical protein
MFTGELMGRNSDYQTISRLIRSTVRAGGLNNIYNDKQTIAAKALMLNGAERPALRKHHPAGRNDNLVPALSAGNAACR